MNVLEQVLGYAARGWPVIPIYSVDNGTCTCPERGDCPSPGKHPLTDRGLHAASVDEGVIRQWWQQWPNANVALRTGVMFDVLDVDTDEANDYLNGVADWLYEANWIAPGPFCFTGGGGWHLYVQPTGGGNRSAIDRVVGFDWRGKDGYVVAPPSLHVSGERYRWGADADDSDELPVPPCPPWLAALARGESRRPVPAVAPTAASSGRTGGWSPHGLIGRLATAVEGERNNVLCWAAHKVGENVASGKVSEPDALGALDELATVAERVGLTGTEVERTIRSGYTAGTAR